MRIITVSFVVKKQNAKLLTIKIQNSICNNFLTIIIQLKKQIKSLLNPQYTFKIECLNILFLYNEWFLYI